MVMLEVVFTKIVYIAHRIGGDVKNNVAKVKEIIKREHTADIYPIAPYLAQLEYQNDEVPEERAWGMACNKEYFTRRFFDELWVYGWSKGIATEVQWAFENGIEIVVGLEE